MFSNYEEVCNLENKENNATEMFADISLIFSESLRILLHIFVGANIMKIWYISLKLMELKYFTVS